jgi:hypothetical protein
MKKVFGIIAITAISLSANAQIKTNAGTFSKPSKGSWLIEGAFTPNLAGGTMFSLPNLGTPAFPVTVVSARKFSSESKATRYSAATTLGTGTGNISAFGVAVGLGIENHMKGAERLSTYWGYGAMLGFGRDFTLAERLSVTAQLFTGFDYYVVPNVYLGAEINYGLGFTSTKPTGGTATTTLNLGSGISSALRIGWKF